MSFFSRLCRSYSFKDVGVSLVDTRLQSVQTFLGLRQGVATPQFAFNRFHSLSKFFRLKFQSNPTLKYLYPPPSSGILANITHALISLPKFYVQVSKHCFSYIPLSNTSICRHGGSFCLYWSFYALLIRFLWAAIWTRMQTWWLLSIHINIMK